MVLEPVDHHRRDAAVSVDDGDLEGGNGLRLLIRRHLDGELGRGRRD